MGDLDTGRAQVRCGVCEREVPQGEFCGACGSHLLGAEGGSVHRRHAFAAHPGEHMLQLSLVSTLFPHLPHRHSTPFKVALIFAAAGLAVLGLLRLTGPAIAVAALTVPLLYLLYLYEVEVYEDEPVLIIALTLAAGLAVGAAFALLGGPIVTETQFLNALAGAPIVQTLLAGAVLPIVAQVLMLLGPAIIYRTRHYDEALDGFTFGAASALGFSLATTAIDLFPELASGLLSPAPAVVNALEIVQRGLLIPIVNASTSGLIAGSFWLRRGHTRAHVAHGLSTSVTSTLLVSVLTQTGLGLLGVLASNSVVVVAGYAGAAVGLLVWVRVALHHMLLAEAVEMTIGPDSPCSHCHRVVPRMAFCPHCGIATRATPKTDSGRLGRRVR